MWKTHTHILYTIYICIIAHQVFLYCSNWDCIWFAGLASRLLGWNSGERCPSYKWGDWTRINCSSSDCKEDQGRLLHLAQCLFNLVSGQPAQVHVLTQTFLIHVGSLDPPPISISEAKINGGLLGAWNTQNPEQARWATHRRWRWCPPIHFMDPNG